MQKNVIKEVEYPVLKIFNILFSAQLHAKQMNLRSLLV